MPRNIYKFVFIALFIAMSAIYAQPLFNEGFDGTTFPPLGWVTYDNVLDYWINDRNGPHVAPGCAFAGKFGGNPHTPSDAWLVTPRLVPTTNHNTLEFWYRGFNRNHRESLEIWISLAGNDKASFMNTTGGVPFSAFGMESWDYALRSISLESFNGQLIYIGFRYVGIIPSRHGVFLDDISGPLPPGGGPGGITYPRNDVGVTAIIRPDTVELPSDFHPSATVNNFGTQSATFLTCYDIINTSNGTTVCRDTANVSNLAAGASFGVGFTKAVSIPTGGFYRIKVKTLLSGDMQSSNDEMVKYFRVIPFGYKDAGVSAIIEPMGELQWHNVFHPTIQVRNYSAQAEQVPATIEIRSLPSGSIIYTANIAGEIIQPLTSTTYTASTPWPAAVGNYEVIAYTNLTGDMNLTNDTAKTTAFCVDVDAGALTIYSPTEFAEPATSVICSVDVQNYSWNPQNINVTLTIGDSYTETEVVNLLAGNDSVLSFDTPWIASSGTFSVRCSTFLAGDMNPANNVKHSTVFVPTRDIQPAVYICPVHNGLNDTIIPDVILPRVAIRNNGNYRVILAPVNLKIYKIYTLTNDSLVFDNTTNVNIYEYSNVSASYPNWYPESTGTGWYRFTTTTMLATDQVPNNNTLSDSWYIKPRFRDIGLLSIRSPNDTVSSGYPIIPKVISANNGNVSLAFGVVTEISSGNNTVYTCTRYVSSPLRPGLQTQVSFDPVTLPNGTYEINSHTIDSDDNPSNDHIAGDFQVTSNNIHDVRVFSIISPNVSKTPNGQITIAATIVNAGNTYIDPSELTVFFDINDSGGFNNRYHQEEPLELMPRNNIGSQVNLLFPIWYASAGTYVLTCSTAYRYDQNTHNDVQHIIINVYIPTISGWRPAASITDGLVKDGGALTYVPNIGIFAVPGYKAYTFLCYDLTNSTWLRKHDVPVLVGKGAALCNDGSNTVYLISGNNTRLFWAYDITSNTWTQLESVPAGPKKRKINGGSGLAYITKDNLSFVYLIKGNGTYENWAYNIESDTWMLKDSVPRGAYGKPPKAGSCVTTDAISGYHYFYLLKSGYRGANEFYKYDAITNTWTTLANLNFTSPINPRGKLVKNGAALAYDGVNTIYAFKGGSTLEFWAYTIDHDLWNWTDNPIGIGNFRKKVGTGASLAYADGNIYAFKGNRTSEFWKYIIPQGMYRIIPTGINGLMTINTINTQAVRVAITPNIVKGYARISYQVNNLQPLKINIYNNNGALVRSEEKALSMRTGIVALDLDGIGAGIYFVQIESGNNKFLEKIVVQK